MAVATAVEMAVGTGTAAAMVVPTAAETPGVISVLNLILVLTLNPMKAGYRITPKSKLTTNLDRYQFPLTPRVGIISLLIIR